MKRRILTLALLFCVLFALAAPACADDPPAITVRAGNATAEPGGTVEIPIYVDIPQGGSLEGIGITVTYDPAALTLTRAALNVADFPQNLSDPPDERTFYGYGMGGNGEYSAVASRVGPLKGPVTLTLVTLTFEVSDGAGTADFPITVSPYGGRNHGDDYGGYTYTWDEQEKKGVPVTAEPLGGVVTTRPMTAIPRASGGFDVVIGAPQEGDRLLAALYSAGGQMKDLTVMSAAAELSGVGFKKTVDAEDIVKFMWVSSGWLPRCAALRWSQS